MTCLVPLLFGICIADPANLSLHVDTNFQVAGDYHQWSGGRDYGGGINGRAQIEMAVTLTPRWTLNYGIEHESLLNTRSDRGQERLFVGITWRPFK